MVDILEKLNSECRPDCTVRHMAFTDVLTGLPNRALFNDRVKHALDMAKRDARHFAIMFLDLDLFKQVNDTHGHTVGDGLLRAVAERIRSKLRGCDTLARMGGDEFTIILENNPSRESVEIVAKKIVGSFADPFIINECVIQTSTSVGIAMFNDHADTVDTLLRYADDAMYRAKNSGRNNYCFYSA